MRDKYSENINKKKKKPICIKFKPLEIFDTPQELEHTDQEYSLFSLNI